MTLNLRSLALYASSPYGTAGLTVNFYTYSTADAAATVLAAGYFNDARAKLKANDIVDVMCLADGVGVPMRLVMTSVPSSGNVTVATDIADEAGTTRAVVPTADGLTTGLLLASDSHVTVTSADAGHIVTLPAIADVPLLKEIWGQNGATACEMRTPALSNTTINGGDADSNESVLAANVAFMAKKVSATNWVLLTIVGGAVAAPTPD